MRSLLALFFLASTFVHTAHAQGCVAIRHFSSPTENGMSATLMRPGDLTIGTSYRYFKSFRHFRGTHEEPDRVANGTEVVNHAHAVDLNVFYALTGRTYASVTLPFVFNTRSSLYEHGRAERNTSFSRGLADARVGVGHWLLDPARHAHFNVALGLGVKLPTGNHNAVDIFYNVGVEGRPEVRPVDQSIQPGDGGVGFTLDFQAFHHLTDHFAWYAGGFYLLNPRETNGVRTFRETLSPALANEAITSVPDQYSLRLGGSFTLPTKGVSASVGVRYEGVPVEDLIGGSRGFRRPGMVLSMEPGVSYTRDRLGFSLSVPVALYRNRPQSVTDLEMEQLTGTARHGDAAFADYLVNVGVSYRLQHRTPRRNLPDLIGTDSVVEPSSN